MKKLFIVLLCFVVHVSYAETSDVIVRAQEIFDATKIVCSGISDEISKLSNVSKTNTVVSVVGTVAAGGALAAGIAKSEEEKEIDALVEEMCAKGGCTTDGIDSMSDEDFFENVMLPMFEIDQLKQKLDKSKNLGNWRTGLMAGTIGTNLASAIISGVNTNQSDLIQHIEACNGMLTSVKNISLELNKAGVGPHENKVVKDLDKIKTWCGNLKTDDVEKIEKRMKVVMGTSIAGTAIGVVGTTTSAAANSDKYMENRLNLTEQEKKKKDVLNTTANIMAGANVATGAVETGFNISLINLTKKLIQQAEQCEEVLQ